MDGGEGGFAPDPLTRNSVPGPAGGSDPVFWMHRPRTVMSR